MLDSDALYDLWAPADSPWSPWVKPVLLAHLAPVAGATEPREASTLDLSWTPPPDGYTAIVCDLPGALGVDVGMALAERGYRPIVLYNALPSPAGGVAVVDVGALLTALHACSPRLAALSLPALAPPVFLLDARRRKGSVVPELFDNRSISFPGDFPSALRLQTAGVREVILLQQFFDTPDSDLAQTLCAWQAAGLGLSSVTLIAPGAPQPLLLPKPSWLGLLWHRLTAATGLRRNPRGGFGDFVPYGFAHGG